MNTTKKFTLAAAVALSLWGGASFAASADYRVLEQSVMSDLSVLGINPAMIGQLTMEELTQLSSILESMDTDAEKKSSAQKLIDDAMAQPERAAANEGTMQLEAQTMSQLAAMGLAVPEGQSLMPSQVSRLTSIFGSMETDEIKKANAQKVLEEVMPEVTPFGKSGYEQLEAGLDEGFVTIGIEKPAFGSLTLSQVVRLSDIFNGTSTVAEQKEMALKVISGT